KEACAHTALYDINIANWFSNELDEEYPEKLFSVGTLKQVLRYGEIPHQKAAVYSTDADFVSITNASQFQGKELSYNNLNDADGAF
ncbi:bifunctional phosphoribosylaminoimidazolecarboxamide formyltransferase/IMP cyclohydrolase, partial [Francisella tularensis subsp. holarctica]|nr:bifunctional phosphoribosylaminoimidazolecarboxamide formyltransferase/IMP cyclohydrolase [Francisella tularensis subsp. holarctica]